MKYGIWVRSSYCPVALGGSRPACIFAYVHYNVLPSSIFIQKTDGPVPIQRLNTVKILINNTYIQANIVLIHWMISQNQSLFLWCS